MEKEKLMAKYGLRDYVYEHLRRKIKKREIERSEILTINQLCIELDISRTPIREAIAQLENEGFVTILPQRGIKNKRVEPQRIFRDISNSWCFRIIFNFNMLSFDGKKRKLKK